MLAFHLPSLPSRKKLIEDLLLIFHNFIHVPKIKKKNNPTTMAVTAYLSKTSLITEVFVISLFQK